MLTMEVVELTKATFTIVSLRYSLVLVGYVERTVLQSQ